MPKYRTTGAVFFLLAILLMFAFALNSAPSLTPKQLRFSDLLVLLDSATAQTEKKSPRITEIQITGQDNVISVKTDNEPKPQEIAVPPAYMEKLIDQAKQAHVLIDTKNPGQANFWFTLLNSFFIPVVLLAAVLFVVRSIQSGGSSAMSFGRSRHKLTVDNKVRVTFQDVAGVDEAKRELQEIVEFLKNPEKFQALGAIIPRGVLLAGSPGTGKTLLAKAVAGEAGVPFFSISGSHFVEMFVGVGASRVRDLFEQAKKHAPCIVFVDEVDAVGRQRGAGIGGGNDEREQTLNQLLVEMDGFEGSTGIIVIAATNRPDILDSALLRPGRFDRQVMLDPPDVKGREQILKVHGRSKPLAKNVEMKTLARRTPGFTGADLSNLLNEAALIAARHNKQQIEMHDLDLAIDKVLAGPEKHSRIMSEKEKQMTAYHEVGHALMCHLLESANKLHKVTIIPRGFALGLTMSLPEEDHLSTTKAQINDSIAVCLGGRIAEELIYGEDKVTTGAQNDLEKSTSLARRMVTEFGMSDRLGPITFNNRNDNRRSFGSEREYGDRVAEIIDEEVENIITKQYKRVKELLEKYNDHMHAIVKELLVKETLDRKQFADIVRRVNDQKGWPNPDEEAPQDKPENPPSNTSDSGTSIDLGGSQPEPPASGLRPSFA